MSTQRDLVEAVRVQQEESVLDFLVSPITKKIQALKRLGSVLKGIQDIWVDAERESGQSMKSDRGFRKAMALSEGKIPDNMPQKSESLSLITITSLALATIGGIPMILKGLMKVAKFLKMHSIEGKLEAAFEVAEFLEEKFTDIVVPDRLSYSLYTNTWKRGFKVSTDLLSFDDYRNSKARTTVERTMYRLGLIYFAYHGILGVLHSGLSMLGAAEAGATTVKGIEIKQALSSILKGLRANV